MTIEEYEDCILKGAECLIMTPVRIFLFPLAFFGWAIKKLEEK